jgi:hypothetical protein
MVACLQKHLPLAMCPEEELAQLPTTLLGQEHHEAGILGTLSMALKQDLSGSMHLDQTGRDAPRDIAEYHLVSTMTISASA